MNRVVVALQECQQTPSTATPQSIKKSVSSQAKDGSGCNNSIAELGPVTVSEKVVVTKEELEVTTPMLVKEVEAGIFDGVKVMTRVVETGNDGSGEVEEAGAVSRTFIDMFKSGPLLYHLVLHCYVM